MILKNASLCGIRHKRDFLEWTKRNINLENEINEISLNGVNSLI